MLLLIIELQAQELLGGNTPAFGGMALSLGPAGGFSSASSRAAPNPPPLRLLLHQQKRWRAAAAALAGHPQHPRSSWLDQINGHFAWMVRRPDQSNYTTSIEDTWREFYT